MEIYKGIVQEGGRVVIPAPIRKEFTLEPGNGIVFIVENGTLTVRSRQQLLEEAQNFFTNDPRYKGGMVEELIADRRKEAARENADD